MASQFESRPTSPTTITKRRSGDPGSPFFVGSGVGVDAGGAQAFAEALAEALAPASPPLT